jgi:hypothetical protein
MDHEQDRPENARERLQRRADEENEQRAQARERMRVAQEREQQERRQRAHTTRTRATGRAAAGRATAARPSGPADAPAATLSVQDVVELFNHPLGEGALRRAVQALAADVAWRLVPQEDTADRLRCVLLHQPSGARVEVDQERSLLGLWNSRI